MYSSTMFDSDGSILQAAARLTPGYILDELALSY